MLTDREPRLVAPVIHASIRIAAAMALPLASTLIASIIASVVLILALAPLLRRYALARPNARSSHKSPTPQGGGVAVIAVALVVPPLALFGMGADSIDAIYAPLAASVTSLAVIGAWDDIRPLPPSPRLVAQGACVSLLVLSTPLAAPLFPEALPSALQIAIAVVAGLWFVNLVNFMDGLDWITVAQMVPPTIALSLFGAFGVIAPFPALVAASLCGGLLGFAIFNKPVARLFLGDVGSLPIGLIVAWLLYTLAGEGHLAAAILLTLYSCADASVTLIRRLIRRERVWEAHRTHFYQRATDAGFSATKVAAHVFAAHLVLALLAAITIVVASPMAQIGALALGVGIVAALLARFDGPSLRTRHG